MFSFKGGSGTSGAGARDFNLSDPDDDEYAELADIIQDAADSIDNAGEAAEESEPKVNKLKEAFNSLKQNVDVVGLMV